MWKELWEATMENQSDCTEDQKKYYEQWMDAQSDLNDLVIDYIKLLKDELFKHCSSRIKRIRKMNYWF